jgi:hypothetical protein
VLKIRIFGYIIILTTLLGDFRKLEYFPLHRTTMKRPVYLRKENITLGEIVAEKLLRFFCYRLFIFSKCDLKDGDHMEICFPRFLCQFSTHLKSAVKVTFCLN